MAPVRPTRMSRPINSLPECAPSKVMDASAALAQSRRRDALAEGSQTRKKSMLALGRFISFGFRKKRHQADSCDVPLTSTPTTTISATGGRTFLLPS